jgi:NAD(P)H-nitrite reductase large subunit
VNRGVLVDDRMRTTDPAILAAGDVAEHTGRCYGLWGAAVEQAEVAAINALGTGATYAPSMVPTHLKVDGLDMTSIGEPHGDAGGAEIVPEDVADGEYRKLVLSEGRIVGAIMVGRPHEAPTVLAAMRGNRDVRGDVEALQSGDWSVLNEAEFEKAVTAAPLARHVEAESSTRRGTRAAASR